MEDVAHPGAAGSQDLPARAVKGGATGITVEDTLGLPALAGTRVLAGSRGIDRVVSRVNVMEVPDILPWVKPDELLLTTGYPLRADLAGMPALVDGLDRRGVAALAVKLHRYLDEVPPAVLRAADECGLPLLELPLGVAFDDVLTQVLTAVLHRQAAVLERSEEVHRALVGVVLEGGGLEELASEVADVLDCAVVVTSADGRVLADAGAADVLGTGRAGSCFDPTGRLRVERESPGVHRDEDDLGSRAVVQVVAGRVDHGRIVAFSRDRLLDGGDVHVLERAATVAALAVTKQLAVSAVEGKYRGDFLRDVVTGRAGGRNRVVAHCRSLGWEVDRPMVAVVAELDPGEERAIVPGGAELRAVQDRLTAAWSAAVRARDPQAPVAAFSQEVVALLGSSPGADPDRLVRGVVREVRGDGRWSFSTGVSRVVPDPADIPAAYDQARRAMEVGRQMSGPGALVHFDTLGAFRLLSQVADQNELRAFVAETLGDLAGDGPDAADLRQTLQVLLDCNLNVAHAARQLHFHYNTLRYRIGKLERLVGPFTEDADLRLDLALALKAMQMRGLG